MEGSDSINSSQVMFIKAAVKPLLLQEVMKESKMLIDSSEVNLGMSKALVRVTDMQVHTTSHS